MKNLTLKTFIDSANIPATLIRSTIRQFGNWESFKESASDIANHGAGGGFSGFIYYVDTVPFTRRNLGLIREFATEQASDIGYESGLLGMIASFNDLNGEYSLDLIAQIIYTGKAKEESDVTTIYNILAFYVLEEVARAYCDLIDQES